MEYEIGPNEPVSLAVVRAVSAVDGRDPCSLRPLTHVMDTDALDSLFDSRVNGEPRTGGSLSFEFNGCFVTVENGEYIAITPAENA